MKNPFTVTFGREPDSVIERALLENEIIQSFISGDFTYQVCLITGVRGSGKTVALSTIANKLKERKDWIVINLNPQFDMIHMLAAELSNRIELTEIFRDAKINLSLFGLGLEIDGVPPITDDISALNRILEQLTKRKKKLLITIDEVSSTQNVREFVSQFQIFMREGHNVFLLMTGLYENVYELQNEKTLTFLYRAPKIQLKPLNLSLIAAKYKEIFTVSDVDACAMAKVTKGYSFAFQVLGHLCWTKGTSWDKVLPEFDAYLAEYAYEKIWSELSKKDKEVLYSISKYQKPKVEDVRKDLGFTSNYFTVYRDRLIKKGIIVPTSDYGHIDFALPRFDEYVKLYYDL